MFARIFRGSLALSFILAGCGPELNPEIDKSQAPEGKVESAERIDTSNDPSRFQLTMRRGWNDLPEAGESLRKPFPSNWWPMKRGGVAYRWLGSSVPAPSEKYDTLVTPDQVREVTMKLAQKDFEDNPVNENAEDEVFQIGPATEWEHKNHGRYGEKDPEGWYGHCNGWASYSLNEDEPIRKVAVRYDPSGNRVSECSSASEAGCVEFDLGDVNALGSELYWHDGARMVGRRCYDAEGDFEFDEAGRIDKTECRDGNPATMHLVMTNMLGLLERPFIVDLNADRQVWNYPVHKFETTRNEEISLEEALQKVGAPQGTTTWIYNTDAVRFIDVAARLWIVEDAIPPSSQPAGDLLDRYTTIENYTYILELDANGDIIGGEFTGTSKTRHPDFLWYSYSNDRYGAAADDRYDGDNDAVRYSIWKQILTLAQRDGAPPPPAGVIRKQTAPNLAIPDNNSTGIESELMVDDEVSVGGLTVRVNITHTYRGDLTVTLRHAGRSAVLHNAAGGSADNLNLEVAVDAFDGMSATGAWTLHVRDSAGSDTGTLDNWSIDLTPGEGGGNGNGNGGNGEVHDYSATPNRAIPDNNPTGISDSISVNDDFTVGAVRVSVDIGHTYRGDLKVELRHGQSSATLHNKTGGSADNLQATFDVPQLANGSASGDWTLVVSDHAGQDVGTLKSWTLELTETGGGGGGTGGGNNTVTKQYETSPGAAIPDNDSNGVAVSLEVADDLRIETLSVDLEITHTYVGDLRVTLEKDGQQQILHDRTGGGADNIRRSFDTAAFRNANARGTWTLRVVDGASQDVGTIDRMSLTIVGAVP